MAPVARLLTTTHQYTQGVCVLCNLILLLYIYIYTYDNEIKLLCTCTLFYKITERRKGAGRQTYLQYN